MIVWSMFDGSGYAALPWAELGHTVYCFNADSADHGSYEQYKVRHPLIHYVNAWIDAEFNFEIRPDFIMAFPPCTDLAVSGSRHFARKREQNPAFQDEAASTARVAAALATKYNVPYMIENPVSVLSSMWRKPDYSFQPYEFGGYLPEGDAHPAFPEYILPRDAYPKKTCLWTGGGFIMPEKSAVPVAEGWSLQQKLLGGKSTKTKVIRSLTPRGFALAVAQYNSK